MTNAFEEFDWSVAPSYEWRDWLSADAGVVKPSATLLNELERDVTESLKRFGSTKADRAAFERSAEMARAYTATERRRINLAKESGPLLTPINPAESRKYRPMEREHSGLFVTFSKLDHRDLNAISSFAHKYGDLGLVYRHQTVRERNVRGRIIRDHSAHGISHLAWAMEICHMREALKLSELRSFDALRRLKWLSDRHLIDVRAGLAFDKARQPRLSIEPLSLISALWAQFALALTSDKRFVECKFCRGIFELSTSQDGSRSDKEFCRPTCKTLDFRKRKKTALRLLAAGSTIAEAAEKALTEEKTVRRWIDSAPAQDRPARKGRK